MLGNSGSRSGAGGGKRLSRWLLVAHWRCTEAFDLSSSLSLSFSSSLFRLLCIVLSATRHLSPSHLSVPPFSLTRPGSLFLVHGTPFVSSFPRVPLLRVNPHTDARGSFARTGVDPSPSKLLPLCVYSSGFDPARLRSPRILRRRYLSPITPLDASSSSPSPPAATPSPSPGGDVAVCYDLHSSRNKTSATVLPAPDDDKRETVH